eukprot:TRINITY_DN1733_c0_g1_i1.p1 TRINITY_DN1733_c0_g1~~TRINITY_DN1733_c0_g1_i1.p1  ORF type:complete len:429 (+),score=91.47 TRINITY_DN1733_c0_g1_i1:690-1976(+)
MTEKNSLEGETAKHIAFLQSAVSSLKSVSDHMSILQKANNSLFADLTQTAKAFELESDEKEKLAAQGKQYEARIKILESQVSQFESSTDDLQVKLNGEKANAARYRREREEARASLREAAEKNVSLDQALNMKEATIVKLMAEVTEKNDLIQTLENQLQAAKEQLAKRSSSSASSSSTGAPGAQAAPDVGDQPVPLPDHAHEFAQHVATHLPIAVRDRLKAIARSGGRDDPVMTQNSSRDHWGAVKGAELDYIFESTLDAFVDISRRAAGSSSTLVQRLLSVVDFDSKLAKELRTVQFPVGRDLTKLRALVAAIASHSGYAGVFIDKNALRALKKINLHDIKEAIHHRNHRVHHRTSIDPADLDTYYFLVVKVLGSVCDFARVPDVGATCDVAQNLLDLVDQVEKCKCDDLGGIPTRGPLWVQNLSPQ